jgi:DNA-binding winged helix-turn-helix (wHTH) protein
MIRGSTGQDTGHQRGQMPNALRVGLLGPLQLRDETGRLVHVGGRQLPVLLTLLAMNAGRVVPAGSLAGQIWPDDAPGNPGNALQTLVSRLRAELRRGGLADVIESYPAGYRLAVPPDAVDVTAFEARAVWGRRALAEGDPAHARPNDFEAADEPAARWPATTRSPSRPARSRARSRAASRRSRPGAARPTAWPGRGTPRYPWRPGAWRWPAARRCRCCARSADTRRR